jgi:hypothetical protein
MKISKENKKKIWLAVTRLFDLGGGVEIEEIPSKFPDLMPNLLAAIEFGAILGDGSRIWIAPPLFFDAFATREGVTG